MTQVLVRNIKFSLDLHAVIQAPKEVKKEIDVTWEDQHKINTFNRLNTLFHELEDEIAVKREEINKIVDASDEIYLSDDIKFV